MTEAPDQKTLDDNVITADPLPTISTKP